MDDIYAQKMRRNMPEAERNIGYLLHPSIAAKLPRSPVIADIGTGTGLCVLKLAESYPDASLHGFDISPALFPAKETLPSQVHLGVMDIRQPPPPSEHGKYDLVHVRLIVAGLKPSEWEPAVEHVTQMLKPGGAIQWEECNFSGTQHIRGGVNSSVQAARIMGARFKEALKEQFSHGWNVLPQIFEDVGLVNVQRDLVSSDRVVETRKAMIKNGMLAIFGWARMVSLSLDELANLEEDVDRDIESGCYVRFDIHIALGFKEDSPIE